jgi:hypothetical protein
MALKPCSPIDVKCDLETNDIWEASHDGESLATCLEIGECFVVVANDDTKDGARFWILICTKICIWQ